MHHFGIAEHGHGVAAVGEGVGGHAGDGNAGGNAGRSQGRVSRGRAPTVGQVDVQGVGAAASEIGDELIVGGVGQHVVEAEGEGIRKLVTEEGLATMLGEDFLASGAIDKCAL